MAVAGFLERLGLVGYGPLEPVLLAALATETPVLLVGSHGTAKSLLIERLAGALGQPFRHYNASLLNYDDLVGIPLPDAAGEALRFVGTPGAIWGAGFVFFDEISRCRPDLQNKLFPIIHERRVAGVELPELRHRWAAMNPPAPEDGEDDLLGNAYLGSEALDPALADRFGFVVRVPGWGELSGEDRLRLVGFGDDPRPGRGIALTRLVGRSRRLAEKILASRHEQLADYVVQLMGLLTKADLPESPRRARMLARNVAAVHAARLLIDGEDAELEESAELALKHGLPQNATDVPPSPTTLIAAHRQAYELVALAADDIWRQVLAESDPARRIATAERLAMPDADLSKVITQTLSEEACPARRMGLATAAFLAFRDRRQLEPSAWEALAAVARRVLEPRQRAELVSQGPELETWREITSWLAESDEDAPHMHLARSFLSAGFPDLWRNVHWHEAAKAFERDLEVLEVGEAA